jgi:hypothetical protein
MKNVKYSAVLATAISYLILQVALPNVLGVVFQHDLATAVAIVGVLVGVYVLFRSTEHVARRRAREDLRLAERQGQARRGLIVLASPGQRTTPAENAIKAHLDALEHCWIITGPDRPDQSPSARQNAEDVRSKYTRGGDQPREFHLVPVQDEHSPQQVYHVVRSIYEQARAYGLRDQDIVADYTGGTKSMSVGMALACSTSEDRDVEYMKPRDVTPTGVAAPESEAEPLLIDVRFGGGS